MVMCVWSRVCGHVCVVTCVYLSPHTNCYTKQTYMVVCFNSEEYGNNLYKVATVSANRHQCKYSRPGPLQSTSLPGHCTLQSTVTLSISLPSPLISPPLPSHFPSPPSPSPSSSLCRSTCSCLQPGVWEGIEMEKSSPRVRMVRQMLLLRLR